MVQTQFFKVHSQYSPKQQAGIKTEDNQSDIHVQKIKTYDK